MCSFSICLFVTDLFHLARGPHILSMLYYVSESSSFLRLNCVCYHVLLIQSSVSGHVGYFHVLTIVNNAVVNMGIQISLRDPAFNSFGHMFTIQKWNCWVIR